MARGETEIRTAGEAKWLDLYEEYGVSLSEGALSRLMTPAPNKAAVENKSGLEHGKRVRRSAACVRKDERDVSLEIHLTARDRDTFLKRYGRFCREVLDRGFLDIRTKYEPGVVYRMTYVECRQFSAYGLRMAKFTLVLNEPDPSDRGE